MNKTLLANVSEPSWPDGSDRSYPCYEYYDHSEGMCPAGRAEEAVINSQPEEFRYWLDDKVRDDVRAAFEQSDELRG